MKVKPKHVKRYFKPLIILIFLLPSLIVLRDIISGSIPFWYDPARDFLLALKNQTNPTLIGQETGIPGLFYGPYWIWSISILLFISKDPRFVVFVLQTLPYFIAFPWLLKKISANKNAIDYLLAWLLFVFAFKNYTTYLWNPHPAPLLLLLLIVLLSKLNPEKALQRKQLMLLFFSGFTAGMLLNFHMSLGIGVLLSTLLFTFISYLKIKHSQGCLLKAKKIMSAVLAVSAGAIITYLPFVIFELRHNFIQTASVIETFSKTVLHDSRVVGLMGLTKLQITEQFLNSAAKLLNLPQKATLAIFLITAVYLLLKNRLKKNLLSYQEKTILSFLALTSISILFVYFSTNNPVWEYHFIGVEILFLVFLLIALSKLPLLKIAVSLWLIYLYGSNILNFKTSLQDDPLTYQSLLSKETIVRQIFSDAQAEDFSVFTYSPSIYTYDFDYLFRIEAEKTKSVQIKNEPVQDNVYLIIPQTSEAIKDDFINYKTPEDVYQTREEWQTPDKTWIIKRVK